MRLKYSFYTAEQDLLSPHQSGNRSHSVCRIAPSMLLPMTTRLGYGVLD